MYIILIYLIVGLIIALLSYDEIYKMAVVFPNTDSIVWIAVFLTTLFYPFFIIKIIRENR